jgi:hypothetical protein
MWVRNLVSEIKGGTQTEGEHRLRVFESRVLRNIFGFILGKCILLRV